MELSEIKAAVAVSEVVGRYVTLKRKGSEFEALCPFHNEKTPSFTVNDSKQIYHCFGCGESGDIFDFVSKMENCDLHTAKAKITGDDSFDPNKAPARTTLEREKPAPAWTPIYPVPDDAPEFTGTTYNPKSDKTVNHKPTTLYPYRALTGALLGYVMRVDKSDGSKWTPGITFCRNESGATRWILQHFILPRPLYGLENLKPDGPVLLVEGEKAKDAAHRLLGDKLSVLTWPGGTNGVKRAKWDALKGRSIVIWPDNDPIGEKGFRPGIKAAEDIKAILENLGCSVVVLEPLDVEGEPTGEDAADFEGTPGDADKWLRGRYAKATAGAAPPPEPSRSNEPPPPDELPFVENDEPFRVLGYDRSKYYYLPKGGGQIIELSASAHSENNLLTLAPYSYWERRFPARGRPDWSQATNELIRRCEAVRRGTFDRNELVRGLGAWMDNGRSVLHVGDRLIVDGVETDPYELETQYVYEVGRPLGVPLGDPLPSGRARKLADVCNLVPWEHETAGILLAGWLVIAPLCGTLPWRPHLWISGPAGSGKSTVMRDIVGRAIQGWALRVEGETTEAGIRQELGADARPVVFDEAEGEDERAQDRLARIMSLARSSASDSGGKTFKGTAGGGGAMAYHIRSCFAFASINIGTKHYADETRVIQLTMAKPNNDEDAYQRLLKAISETMNDDFLGGLLARSLSLLPILNENIQTFSQAAAAVLGQKVGRRMGDLFGAALAGHYSLFKDDKVDFDAAVEWIAKFDWSEHAGLTPQDDATRLLQIMLTNRVTVTTAHSSGQARTLGELVGIATGDSLMADNMNADDAEKELRRAGLRTTARGDEPGPGLWISTTHPAIKKMLRGSTWAANYRKTLLQIEGAASSGKKNMRFERTISSPAVWIPATIFDDEFTEGESE